MYPQPNKIQATSRLFAIDVLKAISIIAVVSFHSILLPRNTYIEAFVPIDIVFSPLKFCVPVLLTISFFLLERSLTKQSENSIPLLRKRLIRLLIPTIFWFVIAGAWRVVEGNGIVGAIHLISRGAVFAGAYYLLTLLQLTPVLICFGQYFRSFKSLLVVFLLQGAIFLIIYASFISNIDQLISIARDLGRSLFIYWFFYPVLGIYLYRHWAQVVEISTRISIKVKCLILASAGLAIAIEYGWLLKLSNGVVPPFDYTMFSCIFSALALFICFASAEEENLPILLKKSIYILSKYSLGIFCINGIINVILSKLLSGIFEGYMFSFLDVFVLKLLVWLFLLLSSLGISILLDKLGFKIVVC